MRAMTSASQVQAERLANPTLNLAASPYLFAIFASLTLTVFTWPIRWLISGAPILQFLVLLGESRGHRVLPLISVWPIFTTLHFVYAICATSWFLYWAFTVACYLAIFIVSLLQFEFVADKARSLLRETLKELHFIEDKIAFFDIPGLEFDKEVDGLMVIRGITFSLSTLSFVVHGVEVGVKLSDDMELAIQVEEVRIKLFRKAEVGDCFANLKGGEHEMTFGQLSSRSTKDADGDAVFIEESEVLRAALKGGDSRRPDMIKMLSQFTGNNPPNLGTPREGWESMKQMLPDDKEASGKYRKRIRFIEKTNAISEARSLIQNSECPPSNSNTLRAAICSVLHSTPSTPHPPPLAIKVATFRKMSKPATRRFLHRLPLLLRILLNAICYFHPVSIGSITVSASGRWIDTLLLSQIFKHYPDQDKEIASLHSQISSWLSDANFVIVLGAIKGLAQVPINSIHDIICNLTFDDVLAYRASPHTETEIGDIKQVLQLAGADLTVTLPTYLLPRHDHLLPPKPSMDDASALADRVSCAETPPEESAAKMELEKVVEDAATIKVAAHARLPVVLNQDLLDFTAALAKAGKIVELEKELEAASHPSPTPSRPSSPSPNPAGHRRSRPGSLTLADDAMSMFSFKSQTSLSSLRSEDDDDVKNKRMRAFSNRVRGGLRVGVKRMVVDNVVNERWIARLVGRIMRKLEMARGEVGYSADVKISMEPYRRKAKECLDEGSDDKLLP